MTSENEPAKERVRRIGQLTKDINGFTRLIREDLEKCFAHQLIGAPEIEKKVEGLLDNYREKEGKKRRIEGNLSKRLRECLTGICLFLFEVRIHFYALEREK